MARVKDAASIQTKERTQTWQQGQCGNAHTAAQDAARRFLSAALHTPQPPRHTCLLPDSLKTLRICWPPVRTASEQTPTTTKLQGGGAASTAQL